MKTFHINRVFLIVSIVAWAVPVVSAADIHVPGDYPTIQAGINAAGNGDTVIIADGTWIGDGNRDIDTLGKAIAVRSVNGADTCIIDCEGIARGFVVTGGETNATVIEGLTVTQGISDQGGGVFIGGTAAPIFRQCKFLLNTASNTGGAAHIGENAEPVFDTCLFMDNTCRFRGGGVYVVGTDPGFVDCDFQNNDAEEHGGGMFLYEECNVAISGSLFTGNTAVDHGGGVCVEGMALLNMSDCTVSENSAVNGGGLDAGEDADVRLTGCSVYNNTSSFEGGGIRVDRNSSVNLENCDIGSNTAEIEGGGAFLTGDGIFKIVNCTVSNNMAQTGGGLACSFNSSTVVDLSTFTGNFAAYGGGISVTNATPQITDCDIHQNSARNGGGMSVIYTPGGAVKGCMIADNTAELTGGGVFFLDAVETVFGGSADDANEFTGNLAGFAVDLFAEFPSGNSIDVTHNIFTGCPEVEYFVAPGSAFDVAGCQAGIDPLMQDVYVSVSGSNSNSGLTPDEPFKTIRYALSHIKASENKPITVHLAPGEYSDAGNGEILPLPMLSHVHLSGAPEGSGSATVRLHGNDDTRLLLAMGTTGAKLSRVILEAGWAESGGAVYSRNASWTLDTVHFHDNRSDGQGAAMYCDESTGTLNHCLFRNNASDRNGGASVISDSTMTFANCLVTGNSALRFGGSFSMDSSTVEFTNTTFSGNSTGDTGGAIYATESTILTVTDSILWGNTPEEIAGDVFPYILHCNIQGGHPGTGNIDADPLFCAGPSGDYYLGQTGAGQSATSPCVDAGSAPAADLTAGDLTMDMLTTRTDAVPDTGTVDMGYHHADAATCTVTGCTIEMPAVVFKPGDPCYCNVRVCNTDPETYTDIPVFMILDVFGTLYFAPAFNAYGYYAQALPPGETVIPVLPQFTWPAGAGSASGIYWYAAMTNPEITELFGEMDTFQFGWMES